MSVRIASGLFALILSLAVAATVGAEQWSLKGDFTDACSCNASCPCLFGSAPTHDYCEGTALLEVKKGNYGSVNLDGVSAMVVYHMGGDGTWTKYYVSDKATDAQVKAVTQLIPAAFRFMAGAEVKEVKKTPVSIVRSDSKVKYSVPAASVEIEQLKNAEGKPIMIQNLPSKDFPAPPSLDHTQCKTIDLTYNSSNGGFHYSGTNGYTSRVDVSGTN